MKTLQQSAFYFSGPGEKRHPSEAFGAFMAGTDPSSAFQTGGSGMNTIVAINQQAPSTTPTQTLSQAQDAYNYLTNMTGLVSAYMRQQADQQKNPDVLFDAKLWQTTVEHIPLWDYQNLRQETFSETITGVELSTKFLAEMVGFAVDIAASATDISAFQSFLTGLGDNIQAGKTTNTKGYETVNLTFGVRFDDGGAAGLQMTPWIKAYFIIFNETNKQVYTSCGSYQSYTYDFEYGLIEGLWQYQSMISNTQLKAQVDSLISSSQIDDVTQSQNYFGGVVNKVKS